MYIAPSGFQTARTKRRAAAAGNQKTVISGRAMEAYGDGTGLVKKAGGIDRSNLFHSFVDLVDIQSDAVQMSVEEPAWLGSSFK